MTELSLFTHCNAPLEVKLVKINAASHFTFAGHAVLLEVVAHRAHTSSGGF